MLLFVAGLGVVNVCFERHGEGMGAVGKGVGWLRGEELFGKGGEGTEHLSGEGRGEKGD